MINLVAVVILILGLVIVLISWLHALQAEAAAEAYAAQQLLPVGAAPPETGFLWAGVAPPGPRSG